MAATGSRAASPRSARSPIVPASTSGPPRRTCAGDRLRQPLELLVRHRPLVGRSHQPAQELLAIEALLPTAALEHGHARLLDALVGGEAVAALLAFAPAPDGVAARLGQPGVDHAGAVG